MKYQYTKKDKVSVIKVDNKIIPIMISNKKSYLIDYMTNIRKVEERDYGIFLIEDIIKEQPNLFNSKISGNICNIEDHILANEYNEYIVPNIDLSIINNSYKEASQSFELMIYHINKMIVSIEITNNDINNKLYESLKDTKYQLEKTWKNNKKLLNLVNGFESSNQILSCNLYEYLNIRNRAIELLELSKEYKDICTL